MFYPNIIDPGKYYHALMKAYLDQLQEDQGRYFNSGGPRKFFQGGH